GRAVGQQYLDECAHRVEHWPVWVAVLPPQEGEHCPHLCPNWVALRLLVGNRKLLLDLVLRRARVGGRPFFALVGVYVRHFILPSDYNISSASYSARPTPEIAPAR